jgi:glycosyltransferase involved in cell wall biosynthesis
LGKKVIWGIFNSNLSPENYSSRTNRIISACGVLAKWIPNTIVSCSDIGSSRHCEIGYPIEKIVFFPTGVDIDRFKMTNPGRRSFRATRGVHSYNFVIGMVARWDTQKDHRTLFRSVAKVTSERSDIELWLAGGYGIDESNDELMAMIREFGLDNQTKLFGSLSDKLIEFYSSLDLFVLSSVGEGVPNVLLEAMSVGLPCIASEVGDVKRVLADTGLIVPPENSERLALAINTILALPQTERESIGVRSRGRIRERYSKSRMMDSFTAIYKNAIET